MKAKLKRDTELAAARFQILQQKGNEYKQRKKGVIWV